MYNNNVKSSTTAGVLGVFLGFVGAHDWYLGNTKKGLLHLCLTASGIILMLISAPLATLTERLHIISIFFEIITVIGYIAIAANVIWGIIEGLTLIIKGDAGLAARGYIVASTPDSASSSTNSSAETKSTSDASDSSKDAKSSKSEHSSKKSETSKHDSASKDTKSSKDSEASKDSDSSK